jgi:hypothetical protein
MNINIVVYNDNLDIIGQLDCDDNTMEITYQLADIKEPEKRKSNMVRNFTLPGTKNNNYWFGNLFDINSDFTMFNPNKKTDAKLVVNGEIVIDGFLQLRKINKETGVDFEGNQIQYECVIYNNFIDLMSELGEQTLFQLDMSEYNHTFGVGSITQSWSHTYKDGYVYPMTGTDDKDYQYNIQYFKPSSFYRAVFDKILDNVGYGWTGSFQNNEQFKREIITYVRDGNVLIDELEKNRRQWRASTISGTTASVGNFSATFGDVGVIGSPNVKFNDDFTTPNFDNDNRWDTTLWEWNIDRNGLYDLSYKLDFDVRISNPTIYLAINDDYGGGGGPQGNTPRVCAVNLTAIVQKWNGSAWVSIDTYQPTNFKPSGPYNPASALTFPQSISSGGTYSTNIVMPAERTLTAIQLFQNQKVRLVLQARKSQAPNSPGYSQATLSSGIYRSQISSNNRPGVALPISYKFNSGSYMYNKAQQVEIVQGDTVDLGAFLPEKIKQKDLKERLKRAINRAKNKNL